MQKTPADAWIGRPSLTLTTCNAHALNTKDIPLRRHRHAAVRKMAAGSDVLLLQEVHGGEGVFAALAEALRAHMVYGSPAPSSAAGGTAIAVGWSLLCEAITAIRKIIEEGRAHLLRIMLASAKELIIMNITTLTWRSARRPTSRGWCAARCKTAHSCRKTARSCFSAATWVSTARMTHRCFASMAGRSRC